MQGGCPHAGDLVRGDADTDSASANADPELRLTSYNGSPNGGSVVRIINSLGVVGPAVEHVMAAVPQVIRNNDLEFVASVIGSDRDHHGRLRIESRVFLDLLEAVRTAIA